MGKYCICLITSSLNGCPNDCGDKAMSVVVSEVNDTLILDDISMWKWGSSIWECNSSWMNDVPTSSYITLSSMDGIDEGGSGWSSGVEKWR